MSETLIRRIYELEDVDIKRVNRGAREVTAYATVFGVPTEISDKHGHYFEEINRSAFNRTIKGGIGRVQVFYNHGYDLSGRPNMLGAVPIATPVDIRPDARGLVTVSRYNDGEVADAVLAAWDGGEIKGQSFSGKVYKDNDRGQRGGLPHIERMELGLREYGPTHSPAYEEAGLIAIRSKDDLRDLLRDMLPGIIGTLPADKKDDTSPSGHGVQDVDSGSSLARARLTLKRKRLIGEPRNEEAQA